MQGVEESCRQLKRQYPGAVELLRELFAESLLYQLKVTKLKPVAPLMPLSGQPCLLEAVKKSGTAEASPFVSLTGDEMAFLLPL